MIRRAIAMPSHRNYADSRKAICSASAYVREKTQTDLHVSDNSDDQSDKTTWGALIKRTPSCGMAENIWNAFKGTRGDYIMLMGDDDRIFSLGDCNLEVPDDIIGIMPQVVAFTPQHGMIKVANRPITEETAIERAEQYFMNCEGSNLGMFTFWRRDIIEPLFDLWCNHHPTKGAICDWAVMNALASSGKTIIDPSTIYFYNLSNWMGDQEAINREIAKLFTNAGMPAEWMQYEHIFRAIDSFIFINRKTSPIPEAERLEAALQCLKPWTFDDVMNVLVHCGLDEKYRYFYKYATGKEWGEI